MEWKVNKKAIEADASRNDFADFIEERCSLPMEHSKFDDLKSNTFDPILDSRMTEDEVLRAAKSMKYGSKARCGIPLPLLLLIFSSISTVLARIYNKVFLTSYPKCWSAVIKCLPKKGKLDIPTVRGIGLKDLLAKLYDAILKRRLERWLQVPSQQTAYQKGKGCYMHVFKAMSMLNYVPCVPYVPSVPSVPACLACPRAHVPTCPRALRAHVPTCLACPRARVPACPTCPRAHVPFIRHGRAFIRHAVPS